MKANVTSNDKLAVAHDKSDAQEREGGSLPSSNDKIQPLLLSPSVTFVMSYEQMSHTVTCPLWYQQPAVEAALFSQCSTMREVAITIDGRFVRHLVARTGDDLSRIVSEATSVYASVEKFSDPCKLDQRIGWDFVIDLDGSDWNETKWIAGQLFRDVILPQFKIAHYQMKFSGRRGIHIIIPEEAFLFCFSERDFPKAYPLVPKQIAKFFDAMIYPESKRLCKIDLGLYTQHRLLRCAYSLHEETGLVSVPIWPENLERFNPKQDADPAHVEVDEAWSNCKPTVGEASFLLDKVAEWIANKPKLKAFVRHTNRRGQDSRQGRVMPCIQSFLCSGFKKGMEGQRNLVLFNIIQAAKRFNLAIDSDSLLEANARSQSPLPEREVRAMFRYHFEKRADQSYSFRTEIMRDAGFCPAEGCSLCRRQP